ncbi:MAG: FeoB small GTPase domain-containing protein, partial [Bifidobacterium sp.]|nr:FeoB small GTPase domain-containing protein [Bifidobacterium sp.]
MDQHSGHSHHRGLAAVLPQRHEAHAGAHGDAGAHGETHHGEPCVVFIGNPNVGKSSTFNALLGAKARVMNAPGTTVLLESGSMAIDGTDWRFVDTPGTYSLLPLSPDEQVAADAVMGVDGNPDPDVVVTVLDATNLARSLYFLAMVLELGRPTVVALTMDDLARKQDAYVDPAQLSRALDGVPVVAVNGRTGEGG